MFGSGFEFTFITLHRGYVAPFARDYTIRVEVQKVGIDHQLGIQNGHLRIISFGAP